MASVHGDRVVVAWDQSQSRIRRGGRTASIRLADLCRESDFVAKVTAGPAESDWQVRAFRVDCDHPSGAPLSEYGVNAFWVTTEDEARAKAAELSAAGRTNVRAARQDWAAWVPAGCRTERTKCRWTKLAI